MAQDLGSAILAGFQGVQAAAQRRQQLGLQQQELEQGERRLGILDRQVSVQEANQRNLDAEAENTRLRRDNNTFINARAAEGYLTSDMMGINTTRMEEGLKRGDDVAIATALDIANRSGELPPGSIAKSIQVLPDGNYAITVENKDGSKGAVTVDGSSNPDSTIVTFTPKRLAGISNVYYKTKVLSNNDVVNPTIFRAYEGQVEADASRNEEFDRIGRMNEALAATSDPGARRALADAFGATSGDTQATDKLLDQIEADYAAAGAQIGRRRSNRNGTLSTSGQPATTAANAPAAAAPTAAPTAVDPKLEGMYKRLAPELEGVTRNRAKNIVGAGDAGTNETVALLKDPKAFSNEEVAGVYDIAVRNGDENTATYLKDVMLNRGYADADIRRRRAKVESDVEKESAARSRDLAASDAKRRREERLSRIRGEPPAGGVSAVAAQVDGRSTTDVDRAIASGKIQVTPDTAAAVQRDLQSKGITNIRQLARLNDRDRAIARAVILSVEKDPTIRAVKAQEISNIFDNPAGSVSLTRQEFEQQEIGRETNRINAINAQTSRINAATSRVNAQNAANRLRYDIDKLSLERGDAAVTVGQTFMEGTRKIFWNEEDKQYNLNAETSKTFMATIMPPMLLKANNAPTQREADILVQSMNPGFSLALAGLASEEIGGLKETWLSLWRENAVNNVDSTDFTLSRVRVQKDGKGKPVAFYYTTADGRPVDEAIPASVVQKADANLYRVLVKASEANQGGKNYSNYNPTTSVGSTVASAIDRTAVVR